MNAFDHTATVPALLREATWRYGERLAVVDGGRRWSYVDLASAVELAARSFLALGIRPGDRVALWMPNRAEYVIALLGALSAGAVAVPMNTRYRGYEATEILARSRASALITANGFLGIGFLSMLREAAGREGGGALIPGLPHLTAIVDVPGAGSTEGVSSLSWEDFLGQGLRVPSDAARKAAELLEPEALCDILFTSGTTGRPKGVMSSHRQTVDVARIWAEGAGLTQDDRYGIVNPFFHSFGYKAGIIAALGSGAALYPIAAFEPGELLTLIEAEGLSVLPGVPTMFTSLLEDPRRPDHDLSSLRFATAGAANVPADLFHRMRHDLGFDEVGQAYGLTECVMVSRSRPNEDLDHLALTTGPAAPGVEIRLADPGTGGPVPLGADGEVLVRGRNVMLGYFEDDESTRAAIDPDGWLHTGDVGRLDEHGCLKITDRLKDMFTVGGFNVYPAEVEAVLRALPEIFEAAVVDRPDPRLGSVPVAFVVAAPGSVVDPAEVIAHCRHRLAGFKAPREVVIVHELPRNAGGKVLKTDLRARTS
ncbi:FadD3 family acyl-CoA ligase [Actinocorallia aurea]